MAERWITWKGRHILVDNDGSIVKNSNDEDYYYHTTTKNKLNEIKKNGLKPLTDIGGEYGLFFSENSNRNENKVYGDIELRFLKNKTKDKEKYIGNYYTKNKIDASDIEIRNNKKNRWEKLK